MKPSSASASDIPRDVVDVRSIRIENLRIFDETFELHFQPGPTRAGQWSILLGDNGVGKTTILRSLVLALADPAMANSLLQMTGPSAPFLRGPSENGNVTVRLKDRCFEVSVSRTSRGFEQLESAESGDATPPLFAYGCQRGTAMGRYDRGVEFKPIDDVLSLFDESASLIHAETWLKRLLLGAFKDQGGPKEVFFDAVRKAIIRVLDGVDHLEVTDDGVWLQGPKIGRAPLAALSDGYVTTVGWILDLMARWADRCQRAGVELGSDFCEQMKGIVLVDEIDLHLHPLWQLDIVSMLRGQFPQLSFVVTTHNPLTLLGAREGEIHVLRRDPETGRVGAQQHDIPPGTRADEVLTGFWFNLPSTLDRGTLEVMEQHRQLLRQGADEQNAELRSLEKKLRERLGTFADTSLDRMALQVAAEIMDEEASRYKEIAPERREQIRDEMLAELRRRREG